VLHKILPLRRLEECCASASVCLPGWLSTLSSFSCSTSSYSLFFASSRTREKRAPYVRPAEPLPQFPTFRSARKKLDTDTAHPVPFSTAPVAPFYSFLAFANSSSSFHPVWPSQISLFGCSSQALVAKMWIVSFWVFPLVSAGMWLGMKALDSRMCAMNDGLTMETDSHAADDADCLGCERGRTELPQYGAGADHRVCQSVIHQSPCTFFFLSFFLFFLYN